MKHLFSLIAAFVLTVCAYAQTDITKFLGIPITGSKAEMVTKLKAKGFKAAPGLDGVLEGQFNGKDVYVHVVTNGNKVYRIMVADETPTNESNIKIRFNTLCSQFNKNQNYISFAEDQTINDDEDISYGMLVKNKRYQAAFYQKPIELTDSTAMKECMEKHITPILTSKFTPEQLANPTEDDQRKLQETYLEILMELCSKKTVWFMISGELGGYKILMYYDNEYNNANGEDL